MVETEGATPSTVQCECTSRVAGIPMILVFRMSGGQGSTPHSRFPAIKWRFCVQPRDFPIYGNVSLRQGHSSPGLPSPGLCMLSYWVKKKPPLFAVALGLRE